MKAGGVGRSPWSVPTGEAAGLELMGKSQNLKLTPARVRVLAPTPDRVFRGISGFCKEEGWMRGSQGRCYSRMGLVCSAGRQPPSLGLFIPLSLGSWLCPLLLCSSPQEYCPPPAPLCSSPWECWARWGMLMEHRPPSSSWLRWSPAGLEAHRRDPACKWAGGAESTRVCSPLQTAAGNHWSLPTGGGGSEGICSGNLVGGGPESGQPA